MDNFANETVNERKKHYRPRNSESDCFALITNPSFYSKDLEKSNYSVTHASPMTLCHKINIHFNLSIGFRYSPGA